MIELQYNQAQVIRPFFQDTYDSCCQSFFDGRMGRAFVDNVANPKYALIQVGDYVYLDGDASGHNMLTTLSRILAMFTTEHLVLVPFSDSWKVLLRNSARLEERTRYAMIKGTIADFNQKKLQTYIDGLRPDYQLKKITKELYNRCREETWSKELVENYPDYETFSSRGTGYVIVNREEIISGATSFSDYFDGYEVIIATKESYRLQGLATVVGAKFVLESVKSGKYPSWDAANRMSVATCEKLGYEFREEYRAYVRIDM